MIFLRPLALAANAVPKVPGHHGRDQNTPDAGRGCASVSQVRDLRLPEKDGGEMNESDELTTLERDDYDFAFFGWDILGSKSVSDENPQWNCDGITSGIRETSRI